MAPQAPAAGGNGPPQGPPYAPQHQALGETPAKIPDIPVNGVFLLLFIVGAAAHMTILQLNKKKSRKFLVSGACFGFCFTRILATTLRIAWSCHPRNIALGIAATIMVYAGIVILFVANLFFTQRIVRAQHPHFGWSKPFTIALPVLIVILVGTILALVAAVIVLFYTYKPVPQQAVRDIQAYGGVVFSVAAFLPIPLVVISTLTRRRSRIRGMAKTMDNFGEGKMSTKIAICLVSAVLLTTGASFRAGTNLLPEVGLRDPEPWYFGKALFYVFNFTLEIIVVYLWWFGRIDKRFYVPDGAKGPGSYAGGFIFAGEPGNEKPVVSASQKNLLSSRRTSYTSLRGSLGRKSARSMDDISWGGVQRNRVSGAYGEDGVEMPHPVFERYDDPSVEDLHVPTAMDVGVEGMDKEMGWDPKSGKWALRPISGVENARHSQNMKSLKSMKSYA